MRRSVSSLSPSVSPSLPPFPPAQLFSQVTQQITLTLVCEQYKSLRYYEGIVELAMCAAAHSDPQNLALHFYRAGQPMEDTAGQKALTER